MEIEDFSFGRIVVDGVAYTSDIKIMGAKVIAGWWRKSSHKVEIEDIQEMIDLNYRVGGEIEEQLSQIPTRYQKVRVAETRVSAEAIAQAPVVRAIDLLIKQAVRDRASDVHVEPQEDRLRIRYRIDGILHEVMSLPLSVHPPLISRVKIMSGLNIAERRRPQDGQITFDAGGREVDIRVATSNTIYGEMVVLRILDPSSAKLGG